MKKHQKLTQKTRILLLSATFLIGAMLFITLIPSVNAGFWDWLFGSNPDTNKVLNDMGVQGMRINNFKVDAQEINKVEFDNSNIQFKTEVEKIKDGIKQSIWITNKKATKNFDYSQLIEIDYSEIIWNGKKYKLTSIPITLGSWYKDGNLIAPNIFMGKEYKRINYRDIAEKGGYALAYEKSGKYYIELRIDNLEIKLGEEYYIDPTFTNSTQGFCVSAACGIGANNPIGVLYDSLDDTFWVLDGDDPAIYHVSSAGTNLTGSIAPSQLQAGAGVSTPNDLSMNGSSFWVIDSTDNSLASISKTGTNLTGGFPMASFGVGAARGIWSNSTDIWITDNADNWVYHFDITHNNQSDGWTAGSGDGQGIVNTTNSFWVLSNSIIGIEQYDMGTHGGISNNSIQTLTGSTSSYGLATDGLNFMVVDNVDDFVYYITVTFEPEFGVNTTLNSPANDSTYLKGDAILFNATLIPKNITLTNATLFIWNSTSYIVNRTMNTMSVSSNETLFNVTSLSIDSYIWNVYGCGENISTDTFCDWDINRTFTVQLLNITSYQFDSQVYETDNRTFYVNFTTTPGVTSVSAILKYNGTSTASDSSCSGGNCTVSATIDIPLITTVGAIAENKTFYWDISLFDGVSLSSSSSITHVNGQNVSMINFSECGVGAFATNFSIYNETDLSPMTATFLSGFDYYLGTGTVKKSYSYQSTTDAHSYDFCIYPNATYITTSHIDLSKNGFEPRSYDFINDKYTNITSNISLYLINSTAPTNIIIEVKDQGLIALRNIVVNISKYYPEQNKFIQVEKRITDDNGQFVAKLIQNDAKYMFEFYDINRKFLKQSPSIIITCKVTVGCTVPFVIETESNEFDEFTNLNDYSYEFTFNNNTNLFRYAWDDQTGETTITRLEVTRLLLNGSSIICNTSSASTLSVLSCDVGSQRASYKVNAFRTGNNEVERRIAVLNVKVGDMSSTFGLEGLLWVFILLFTGIGIGVFNPSIGSAIYGVGFIAFGLLGIISMPIEVFFANTIITIVFIWAVRT